MADKENKKEKEKEKNTEKESESSSGCWGLITREFWGMVVTLFSAFMLFCLFSGGSLFYPLGEYVQVFTLGVLGFFSCPLFLFTLLCGIMIIIGKKPGGKESKGIAGNLTILLAVVCFIIHLIASPIGETTFGEYVSLAYNAPANGVFSATFGGAVFAMINYGLVKAISLVGVYVLYSAMALIMAIVLVICIMKGKSIKDPKFNKTADKGDTAPSVEPTPQPQQQPIVQPVQPQQPINVYYGGNPNPNAFSTQRTQRDGRKLVLGDSSFELKSAEDYAPIRQPSKREPINPSGNTLSYTDGYQNDMGKGGEYYKKPSVLTPEKPVDKPQKPQIKHEKQEPVPTYDDYSVPDGYESVHTLKNYEDAKKVQNEKQSVSSTEKEIVESISSASDENIVDMVEMDEKPLDFNVDAEPVSKKKDSEMQLKVPLDTITPPRKPEVVKPVERVENVTVSEDEEFDEDENPIDLMPLDYKYNAPPTSLLKNYDAQNDDEFTEEYIKTMSEKIVSIIKIISGHEVQVAQVVHGPTVTRFDIKIPDDVSVKSILKYADDLALRLEAAYEMRISNVKGTSYIGIELPNKVKQMVGLRSVVESEEFKTAKQTSLTFAIGKDTVGKIVVTDICKMPHLLIAGSTGTGKSVGLNSLLVSLMMKYSPADLRLMIVDPKMVEFAVFEKSPHMLFGEVLNSSEKAVSMLDWLCNEMDARYLLFKQRLVQGIDDYNATINPEKQRKMYRIVVIIDEFADLMSKNKKQIEEKIARIAQKARAAGIYLILATQRPSVNIMEGSIKTNFTSRIAFKMSNAVDSTTILGEAGAEKLLGAGDLFYRTSTMSVMERAQGAYVSMEEIKAVMAYIMQHNKSYYNETAHKIINHEDEPQIESINGSTPSGTRVTPEYIDALRFAVERQVISISQIQREFGFGFPRAAKIFDWMAKEGYVLNTQTGKQKQVLLTMEEFEAKFGG